MRAAAIAVLVVLGGGCALIDDFGEFQFRDPAADGGGVADGGPSDAGPPDAAPGDAGPRDAGPRDAGEDAAPDAGLCGGAVCGPCRACVGEACVPLAEGVACPGGTCHGGECCSGCWDGTECREGDAVDACGRGGVACRACACDDDACDAEGRCAPADPARHLSAGAAFTCTITAGSALWCWGYAGNGQLGVGIAGLLVSRPSPQSVAPPPSGSWAQVEAGAEHACAITDGGLLHCWGRNHAGQLGRGDRVDVATPAEVTAPMTTWARVAAGGHFTCGVDAAGTAQCWGSDVANQLGNGDGMGMRPDVLAPAPVTAMITPAQLALGHNHACARVGERLWCWGDDRAGQIGTDMPPPAWSDATVAEPVELADTWSDVAGGALHSCAIRAPGGELYCWGTNDQGQLGLGPTMVVPTPYELPQRVGTAVGWRRVSAGEAHTCALDGDGVLHCFGAGGGGRLGIGGVGSASSPTHVPWRDAWEHVTLGDRHSCGIDVAGAIHCWGNNGTGQLGVGDYRDRTAPARVCLPPAAAPP